MDLPPSPDNVIDALRDLTDPASQLKDPSTLHTRAGALFARLKALNRAANVATKAHKQATADARHHMDQTHLELQNLLYEKRHLEREIDKCRQFAYVASPSRRARRSPLHQVHISGHTHVHGRPIRRAGPSRGARRGRHVQPTPAHAQQAQLRAGRETEASWLYSTHEAF